MSDAGYEPYWAIPDPTAPFDVVEVATRVARHIDPSVGADECWEWNGGRTTTPYASVVINGRDVKAQRVTWMLANRIYDLTRNDFICHHCDNNRCVNPAHLYRGNSRTNVDDMFRRGRATPTEQRREQHRRGAPRGDQHWMRRMPELRPPVVDGRWTRRAS